MRPSADGSSSLGSGAPRKILLSIVLLMGAALFVGTACTPDREQIAASDRLRFALAIHGGAGHIPRDISDEKRQAYLDALTAVLELGVEMLERGDSSLDVVVEIVQRMEDDPLFNAGRGAVFTREGKHELDAAVMNGRDLQCGAVTGVTTVKNPIRLARLVMTDTKHVLLSGAGAESFADLFPDRIERVENDYFFTERRYKAWQERQRSEEQSAGDEDKSTVGAVALDRQGNLAAATSTGGLTFKRFGRVGDTPLIGAGTYANEDCAVSCTGRGEEFIRRTIAFSVASRMAHGLTLKQAADATLAELAENDGGLIAVGRDGSISMIFNTTTMTRAAADSSGRFEVAIWK